MRRVRQFFSLLGFASVIAAGAASACLLSQRRPSKPARRSSEPIGSKDVGGSTLLGARASSAARSGSGRVTTTTIAVGAGAIGTGGAIGAGSGSIAVTATGMTTTDSDNHKHESAKSSPPPRIVDTLIAMER
jgi:ABC-type phosphate transport system substrate-binding protein